MSILRTQGELGHLFIQLCRLHNPLAGIPIRPNSQLTMFRCFAKPLLALSRKVPMSLSGSYSVSTLYSNSIIV